MNKVSIFGTSKIIFQKFFPKFLDFLVYSKNHFNIIVSDVLMLYKITANQTTRSLNRALSLNFLLLRSAKHVKFTEECAMFSSKKMFTNGLNVSRKNSP